MLTWVLSHRQQWTDVCYFGSAANLINQVYVSVSTCLSVVCVLLQKVHLCDSAVVSCVCVCVCVGVLCAATWPSPLSHGFPALCVFAGSPQINCRVLSVQDSMVSLSSFSPVMRLPQRISVWAEAITAHIQSHLSQEPNEGAFDRPRLMHIYFLRPTK